MNDADIRINTDRTDNNDNLVRVAAGLKLYPAPDTKLVDVIIGGQYGSEGKGNIAAYLAQEYDIIIRVGGPNAGHTVSSESGVTTYYQLPSGSKDTKAEILLGPGMTIDADKLLKEIEECNISSDRLFIDPQCMLINESDCTDETSLVNGIGSTGRGSGAAAARRIMQRNTTTRLAKDDDRLKEFVGCSHPYRGSTYLRLEKAFLAGKSILLEGTQGSGLSLYHGQYPYVTSRDTNVAGCLAEAGISPSRVRKILLVTRYTPIRVANPEGDTSGPLKHEVSFDEISLQANLSAEEVKTHEHTSVTKKLRRASWFDWELFRKSASLNAPTDIVLTFADYIDKKK
jgi:adenylosuccinate synthase